MPRGPRAGTPPTLGQLSKCYAHLAIDPKARIRPRRARHGLFAVTAGRQRQPLRVLHVIPHFGASGGAETSTREIMLRTEGSDLSNGLAVLTRGGIGAPALMAADIPVFQPDGRLSTRRAQIRHVREAIAAFCPDLVTTVVFDADLAGRIAALDAGVPVLTSLVNTTDPGDLLLDTDIRRWKLTGARWIDTALAWGATSAFHAITEAVAEHASRRLHIARSRITVVPRGRDRGRLGQRDGKGGGELRRTLGVGADAVVLLNIAREEPQKGQVHLIRALAELRSQGDFHLVIAGRSGRASLQLDAVTADHGMGSFVHRLGYRSDLGTLHGAADVFVFPSIYEGLGGSVLEAMALDTPIVASRIPALSEVLGGGACAQLVPAANSDAIAAAVRAVLADPAATSARTEAARRRFEACYTLEECAAGMTRLYTESARLDPPSLAHVVSSLKPSRLRSRFQANTTGHSRADHIGH